MIESFEIEIPAPAKYLPVVSFAAIQVVPFHFRICPEVAPMRLIFAPVTDVSANLIVVTTPSFIYSESNLPRTSPFALMRSMVTSFDESLSPILMMESFEIEIPAPAKYLPVVSFAAIQLVPFHLRICPAVAPMLFSLAAVTELS